jgi:hypothetical protein
MPAGLWGARDYFKVAFRHTEMPARRNSREKVDGTARLYLRPERENGDEWLH